MTTHQTTFDNARQAHRALRDAILQAALAHVPFDGWTWKAVEAGAVDAGYPAVDAARAFPGGLADLADHFGDWSDRRMVAELAGMDLAAMRIRDRVAAGVRARLTLNAPYREAISRMLSFLALPGNAPLAARMNWRACDHIWFMAGDRSADFNHYTKRGLLAPVFTATVLYWIGDESEDFADTWAFLDRRIDDVLAVTKLKIKAEKALGDLPSPLRLLRRLRRGAARARPPAAQPADRQSAS